MRHSLSPVMHNAAYEALGLDACYLALPVEERHLLVAIESVRALSMLGVSVTAPYKSAVIPGLDQVTDDARLLDAVNCVALDSGKLVGHNTDGEGFVASLREAGCEPAGKCCLVEGAGGAARSVILALVRHGADVVVRNRSREKADHVVTLAGSNVKVGGAGDEKHADVVINATTLGMEGTPNADAVPVDVSKLSEAHVVADLVYHPRRTKLLQAAAIKGATTVDGTGMLLHQAAEQVRIWTGRDAPVDVMRKAAGL